MKTLNKAAYFVALVFLASSAPAFANDPVQGALDSLGVGQGQGNSETVTLSSGGNSNSGSSAGSSNPTNSGSNSGSSSSSTSSSSTAPANGTVVNNGSTPVVIVVNVGGKKRIEQVQPGQTYTAPSGTTKIGFFSAAEDVTVTTSTGESRRFNDGTRPSTVTMGQTSNVTVNNGAGGTGGTLILPPVSGGDVNSNNQGANLGTGMSQSPTDGPVGYGGDVHGLTSEMEQKIKDELKKADHEREFFDIQDKYNLSDGEFGRLLAAVDGDRWFWYYSGSGASFGDWVAFNHAITGFPTGGPPFGAWTQHNQRISIFSSDSQLIDAIGTDQFSTLFETQFGDQGFAEDIDARF